MKLCIAGMDTLANPPYSIVIEPDTSTFVTFFYSAKAESALQRLDAQGHRGLRIVDSGAFSYLSASGFAPVGSQMGAKRAGLPPIREYYNNYVAWLVRNYSRYAHFVELDLQELYGWDLIEEFRAGFRAAGLGSKMIRVFHTGESMDDLQRLISTSESGYIGCEGLRLGHERLPYKDIIRRCYNAGVKVHGFAFTRSRLLRDFPFYSVDSSSVLAILRYGVMQVFDKYALRAVPVRTKGLKVLQDRGYTPLFHPRARGALACYEKAKTTELEYRKLEAWLTRLWTSRGIVWKD